MAIKPRSSTKISDSGGIKVAIHAAAGMGKTLLAATAPNPIIILTERTGADSLSPANIEAVFGGQKGITKDIPVLEAYTTKEIEEAIEYARGSDHETIVFDSVSEMSKIRLKEEMPKHKNGMQAYGQMASDVDVLLREMRDDDKNWVFLFHTDTEEVYDDEGEPSATLFVPGFEGRKMGREFPYMIGDIYCIVNEFSDEGEEKRMLRTRQGDTASYAKNRRGRLDELERMHLGSLFWKLKRKTKK